MPEDKAYFAFTSSCDRTKIRAVEQRKIGCK
jgi:hypothetical protein